LNKSIKSVRTNAGVVAFLSFMIGLLFSGCETPGPFVDAGGLPPRLRTGASSQSAVFQIGDLVTIIFSPEDILQPHQEAIKEDGTIAPPLVGSVVAVGRLTVDLQNELQDKYNKIFKNLTVTVLPRERYFYVTGQVRRPGPCPYIGETDIIKAIAAAGDLNEFANQRKIQLTRTDGQKKVIDYRKALRDPRYNVPVNPGDRIHVPRSLF
jgi:polysaccharide export outer membrane protein